MYSPCEWMQVKCETLWYINRVMVLHLWDTTHHYMGSLLVLHDNQIHNPHGAGITGWF